MKKAFLILLAAVLVTVFTSCGAEASALAVDRANSLTSDAAVARRNLETAEQNFQVFRRVVFYNGITGDYILVIEGMVAVTIDPDGDLVATVKTNKGTYLKHYLGLSDNVTYFSEALDGVDVSARQYKVIFKPSVILPTIEIR